MALVCPLYARLHHSRNVTIASSQRRHVTVSFLREKKKKENTALLCDELVEGIISRSRDYFSITDVSDHRVVRTFSARNEPRPPKRHKHLENLANYWNKKEQEGGEGLQFSVRFIRAD